ncbi:MAG: FecR domain-containing protein [Betaproteobacteria bacterium]|nr:FecR domain-containing protein [Betaproteobacteria bacterium]
MSTVRTVPSIALRVAAFAVAFCMATGVQAAAGFVQFVSGEARVILRDGSSRPAQKGVELNEGDTVVTGRGASAQLRMSDQGLIALRQDSQLLIDTYRYNGSEDGTERSVLGLLRGGFRTLTGVIGRTTKTNYLIRTPNATIGIRGTDHETVFIASPSPGEVAAGVPGTYNKVNAGSTFVETPSGRLNLEVNQVGFAGLQPGVAPIRLESIPAFMRATSQQQGRDDKRAVRESASGDRRGTQTANGAAGSNGSTGGATQTATRVEYVQTTSDGALTFAQAGQALTAAPAGYAGVGGDKSGSILGSGALRVSVGGDQVLFGADGQMALLSSADGFRYARSGAAAVHSGRLELLDNGQAVEVKWGVYSGGAIVDNSGSRAAQFFHFMGAQGTPPGVVQSLSGSYTASMAHTPFITETGTLGGSLNSVSISLNNGNLTGYSLGITDGQGRSWSGCAFACSVGSVGLVQFADKGVQLTGSGPGGSVSGNAHGLPVGPNGKGVISSFDMKTAGGAAVTGSFLVKDPAKP